VPVQETKAAGKDGKVVVVALYNRLEYSRKVLDALAKCDGIGGYHVIFGVDKGDPQVLRLAHEYPKFPNRRVFAHSQPVGCDANIKRCLTLGFGASDYVVLLEDDVVPAKDFLTFFEHCRGAYRDDPDVHTVGAYNKDRVRPGDYHLIFRKAFFVPWGWATWLDRWKEPGGMRDNWAYRCGGWDQHLSRVLSRGRSQVRPFLSRVQNIGAVGGCHVVSPEWHAKHQFNEFWAGSVGNLPPGEFHESKKQ